MSDIKRGIAPQAEEKVGRALKTLSRWLAYFGGIALTGAAIMTVVSIIGRAMIWAGLGPVPGDFELVELACAVAVFSFLPWGQFHRGQVTVDVLVDTFPSRVKIFLGLLGDVTLAIVSSVILWRLWLGFGERFPHGSEFVRDALMLGDKPYYTETTFILRMPIWYGYALTLLGAFIFAIVCFYTVWRAFNWLIRGQEEVNL